MEYDHTGVGTIVEQIWWVQCTHVHVVYGGKVIEILQVMGITVGMKGGLEMEQRGGGGRFMPKILPKVSGLWQPISDHDLGQGLTRYMYMHVLYMHDD